MKVVLSILLSVACVVVIFGIGFKIEYPNFSLSVYKSGVVVDEFMEFEDINTIKINADSIDLVILESDVTNITFTNTIENKGKLMKFEPKVFVFDNTLIYDQNLIMGWDAHSTGSLIIEIPRDLKLDYVINNSHGNIDFSVKEANDLSITCYKNDITINTSCENLLVNSKDSNVNINETSTSIKVNTKNGNVSIKATEANDFIDITTKDGNVILLTDKIGGYKLNNKYNTITDSYSHVIEVKSSKENIIVYDIVNGLGEY